MKYAIQCKCKCEAQSVLEKMQKEHPDWRWHNFYKPWPKPADKNPFNCFEGPHWIAYRNSIECFQKEPPDFTLISAQEYLDGKIDEGKWEEVVKNEIQNEFPTVFVQDAESEILALIQKTTYPSVSTR